MIIISWFQIISINTGYYKMVKLILRLILSDRTKVSLQN
ncbi:unnamed protein product [Paramecium octaurelia]|uniref:Uncharacterized protein n=1 Tax=Paramecium octaurelia TaxID=43137 RepID=A0A8S1YE92_PAROT|nr:unnamed protein product [Paramecium octaurelia]